MKIQTKLCNGQITVILNFVYKSIVSLSYIRIHLGRMSVTLTETSQDLLNMLRTKVTTMREELELWRLQARKETETLQVVIQDKERMQEEAANIVLKNKSLSLMEESVYSRLVVARERLKEVLGNVERENEMENAGIKMDTKSFSLKDRVAAARKAEEEQEKMVLETVRKLALVEGELCRTDKRMEVSLCKKVKLEEEMKMVRDSLKSMENRIGEDSGMEEKWKEQIDRLEIRSKEAESRLGEAGRRALKEQS